ncbi:hypothetical protein LSH36_221g02011 [Paralvinella palmiformis]|uniref:Uncharacterized protein n=1 Tax=Paralvinella palmiformis TaxID=53620 RepID=A0AAD9N5U7_9ANNE|nr:hypothetical protein LSH36_221g02011 [Paralvinella palmiformis]
MMMKDREKQLQNVENEQKMDTVQNRFPNDDLQLQEKDKRNKNPIKRRATAGAVLLKSLSKRHNHQR